MPYGKEKERTRQGGGQGKAGWGEGLCLYECLTEGGRILEADACAGCEVEPFGRIAGIVLVVLAQQVADAEVCRKYLQELVAAAQVEVGHRVGFHAVVPVAGDGPVADVYAQRADGVDVYAGIGLKDRLECQHVEVFALPGCRPPAVGALRGEGNEVAVVVADFRTGIQVGGVPGAQRESVVPVGGQGCIEVVFQVLVAAVQVQVEAARGACLEPDGGIQLLVGGGRLGGGLRVGVEAFQTAEIVLQFAALGLQVHDAAGKAVGGIDVGRHAEPVAEAECRVGMDAQVECPGLVVETVVRVEPDGGVVAERVVAVEEVIHAGPYADGLLVGKASGDVGFGACHDFLHIGETDFMLALVEHQVGLGPGIAGAGLWR